MNNSRFQWVVPTVIAVVFFLTITSWKLLDPTNIGWLTHGDPAQHYLGWLFFRNSEWGFPFGANPSFGLELSNSISYSDSIPFLAFIFKPFTAFLPSVFQYFGYWILICFIFQAIFSWRLAGIFYNKFYFKLCFSVFCVIAPPFLYRLHGHTSLLSQFLIIFSLVAYFEQDRRAKFIYWMFIIPFCSLVHAYILAMVLAIWLASLADGRIKHQIPFSSIGLELICVIVVTAVLMWQSGYFMVSSGADASGYGFYHTNLLSLFDSDGWSYVFKDFPSGDGDYEGFNYLGSGSILLLIGVLPLALKLPYAVRKAFNTYPALSTVMLGFTLFAITNTIGIATYNVQIGIPDALHKLTGIFRASGRMFWPVYYVLMLCLFLAVVKFWKAGARWWLLGAMCIQVLDTSAGWTFSEKFKQQATNVWATPMQSEFWNEAARRYNDVKQFFPLNNSPNWKVLSYYAALNEMGTDAVYLARVDAKALQQATADAHEALQTGRYDHDTLYILDRESALMAVSTLRTGDMLATVDGFTVLAPDCPECAEQFGLSPPALYGPTVLDEEIALSRGNDERYLRSGWCQPEDWGVWSCSTHAALMFEEDLPEHFKLVLRAQAFGPSVDKEITATTTKGEISFKAGASLGIIELDLMGGPGVKRIEFDIPSATSPKELGINGDERQLGLGMSSFIIKDAP